MATNGLFTQTVTLTPADLTAIGGASAVFLQIQVDSDTFPRQKVEPEMYALFSQTASNATQLGGQPASSYLTTTAASAAYAPATGSTAYAPASGSANYAPATGSANYAPATGSSAYQVKIAWPGGGGTTCPGFEYLYGVAGNGTPSCGFVSPQSMQSYACPANQFLFGMSGSGGAGTGPTCALVTGPNIGDGSVPVTKLAAGAAGNMLVYNGTNWTATSVTTVIGASVAFANNTWTSAFAQCASNHYAVGGGCATTNVPTGQAGVNLVQSYSSGTPPNSWTCTYSNTNTVPAGANWSLYAEVHCL
jgi:hypothetical protein